MYILFVSRFDSHGIMRLNVTQRLFYVNALTCSEFTMWINTRLCFLDPSQLSRWSKLICSYFTAVQCFGIEIHSYRCNECDKIVSGRRDLPTFCIMMQLRVGDKWAHYGKLHSCGFFLVFGSFLPSDWLSISLKTKGLVPVSKVR